SCRNMDFILHLRSKSIVFELLRIARALRSTLFPYTTLFRSKALCSRILSPAKLKSSPPRKIHSLRKKLPGPMSRPGGEGSIGFRSEEHTSELQSRENLVCRLLLEKKKT